MCGEVHGLLHTAVGLEKLHDLLDATMQWSRVCCMLECGAGLVGDSRGQSELLVCFVQAITQNTCSSRALPGDIVQQQGPQQLKSACLLQSFHILHGRRKRH